MRRSIKDHQFVRVVGIMIVVCCLVLLSNSAISAAESPSINAINPISKPAISPSNPASSEHHSCARVLFREKGSTGLDLTNTIGSNLWEPRSCRAENGDYYVVVQTAENFPSTNIQLHVYRSTGDPHQYPWEYVIGIENTSGYDLYNHDIEIVSSADRGYLIYSDDGTRFLWCFWWILSDPSNHNWSQVGFLNDWDYSVAITSDEVSYNGADVWLYATWVENETVKFNRSTDLGLTWEDPVYVAEPWVPPTSAMGGGDDGQGITFCPGNNKVFIVYMAPVDSLTQSIFVATSTEEFGSGDWYSVELAAQGNLSTHDRGITSMFGGYILVSWRYLGTLRYVYSDAGGSTWSSVYDFNLASFVVNGVACASNNDGYFSIFCSSGLGLNSYMTDYTCLNSTSSWTEMVVDSLYSDIDCFACISDGINPDHGGVWSYAQQASFFGWAGEPELEVDTTGLFFQRREGYVPPPPQPIVVTNNGTCGMGWDAEDDSPWMALNPTSGSSVRPGDMDTIWVSMTPDWPGPGYYFGTVTVNSPGAAGSPQTVDVELQCYGDVLLNLAPDDPPIVVPEAGGSFNFNLAMENMTSNPQTFDLWTQIRLPGYGTVSVMTAYNIQLPGNASVDRDRAQTVPGFAPPGEYTYWGFIGDYPWVIEGASAFTFEKVGTEGDESLGTASDWLCTGDLMPGTEGLPARFILHSPYPNPFNPTTTLCFSLPEAGKVSLKVYDVSGRSLADLVNGWRDAGIHRVTFDASGLPSGVYLARLTAGDVQQTRKLLLIK